MSDKEKQLNIQLDPKIAEGTFANLAMIAHNDNVFILDFINVIHGTNQGSVKSRVVVTPAHAKRLVKALQENIEKFEKKHGTVNEPIAKPKTNTINFGDINKELN